MADPSGLFGGILCVSNIQWETIRETQGLIRGQHAQTGREGNWDHGISTWQNIQIELEKGKYTSTNRDAISYFNKLNYININHIDI